MDKSAGYHFSLLPFMVEEDTQMGKTYHDLLRCVQDGQAKPVWKKILQIINSGAPHLDKMECLLYQCRMFVSYV